MKHPKTWYAAHLLLSLAPLIWCVLMLAYTFHLRASDGYWPRAMIDNPRMDTLSQILDTATGLLFFWFGLPVLLCWAGLTQWLWISYSARQRVWTTSLMAAGILACFSFIHANPHGFVSWWID